MYDLFHHFYSFPFHYRYNIFTLISVCKEDVPTRTRGSHVTTIGGAFCNVDEVDSFGRDVVMGRQTHANIMMPVVGGDGLELEATVMPSPMPPVSHEFVF